MSDTQTTIAELLGLAETAASVLVPGGALVAGFTVPQVITVMQQLWAQEPNIVAAIGDVQRAISGGAAPSAVDLTALKAAVDNADDTIQQDAAASGTQ